MPPRPAAPLPPAVFIDASTLVALADRDDATHAGAVAAYEQLRREGYRLFTTNHALAEAHDLIALGLGVATAATWLADLRLSIYHADEHDFARARSLLVANTPGNPTSMADAVNLVVLQRLGVRDVFAVDPTAIAEMS
jgi:predicted nucleic acid-binding protein